MALEVNGKTLELDGNGNLVNPNDWDEDVAKALAAADDTMSELTQEHMDVLNYLRDQAAKVRTYSLANLPDLLEQLEQTLQANGIQVHWAENGAEANQIGAVVEFLTGELPDVVLAPSTHLGSAGITDV